MTSYDLQLLSPVGCGERVRLQAQFDGAFVVDVSARDGRLLARAATWPRATDRARTAFVDLDAAVAERLRAGPPAAMLPGAEREAHA